MSATDPTTDPTAREIAWTGQTAETSTHLFAYVVDEERVRFTSHTFHRGTHMGATADHGTYHVRQLTAYFADGDRDGAEISAHVRQWAGEWVRMSMTADVERITAPTCPYCGPLRASGTYRDPGDPPRARYCRRCGRPVVGADLTREVGR